MEKPVILLVEDHATTRKLVRMALERAGMRVHEAKDGQSALALMAREAPALVIQDLVLPDMDGFTLVGALRARAGARPVRIVAFSGLVSNLDSRRIAEAGFDDVIAKPVATAKLVTLIEAQLARDAPGAAGAIEPARVPERAGGEVDPLESALRRCSALSAELTILTSLSTAVLHARDVEGALVTALTTCLDATDCALGVLYLLDRHGQLHARRLGRAPAESAYVSSFFGNEPWLRASLTRGDAVMLTRDEPGDPVVPDLLGRAGVARALLIPLGSQDGTLGGLLLGLGAGASPAQVERFRGFAEGIATQVATALALARAFRDREVAEREAEQQRRLAREQTAMWRALVEHAPDLVLQVDFDGRLRFANRAPDGAPISTWFELVSPEYHPQLREVLAGIARDGGTYTFEASHVDAHGVVHWTESHCGPVRSGGGDGGGVLIIQRDTTQKKQADVALITADRLAAIGSLVAGVAHEINNPLSSVMANIELALRDVAALSLPQGNELFEGLSDAREAAERVRRIVQDLRIFSRAEEGRRGPVDVEALLESALRLTRSDLHYRARLVKKIDKVPPVEANEAQLGQVLLNLIASAANAIEPGHAARHEFRIELSARDAETVALTLRHTGRALGPSDQARLFSGFGSGRPGGTGVGLSLSRRIVEAIGGSIEYESQGEAGATFHLLLPASTSRAAQRVSARARGGALRRGRVLVIDDEPLVTEVVRRTLIEEHDVVALDDAREGLARITHGERFDVVLCDLTMPQMTGIEFHEALSAACPEQATRLVFMTAGAFMPHASSFLAGLDNPRLHKPLERDALRSLVNGMVR
ncbi:MAG: response regulator [Polyangiales bacterium]